MKNAITLLLLSFLLVSTQSYGYGETQPLSVEERNDLRDSLPVTSREVTSNENPFGNYIPEKIACEESGGTLVTLAISPPEFHCLGAKECASDEVLIGETCHNSCDESKDLVLRAHPGEDYCGCSNPDERYDGGLRKCIPKTTTITTGEDGEKICSDKNDDPTPCPNQADTTLLSLKQCQAEGYNDPRCSSYANEKAIDEEKIRVKKQSLIDSCVSAEDSARSSCNDFSQRAGVIAQGQSPNSGNSSCAVAEGGLSAKNDIQGLVVRCESVVTNCNSICNRSIPILWTSVSVASSRCSPSLARELTQLMTTQSAAFNASISQATQNCQASKGSDAPIQDPTSGVSPTSTASGGFLDKLSTGASVLSGLSSSLGEFGRNGGSGSGSFDGGSSSSSFNDSGFLGDELAGTNPSPFSDSTSTGGGGSGTGRIGDDSVDVDRKASSTGTTTARNTNNGGGSSSSPSSIGSSGNGPRVGANAKKRKFKTAKARNLFNGYKNIKTSDGGSSVSIRPFDFKKFGSKKIKRSLASARNKHGKKLPLIFRNGKFVLDFLAMKDSKRFKAKAGAMESYWKGKSRKNASLRSVHAHPNANLNIFKLMSFKVQKVLAID